MSKRGSGLTRRNFLKKAGMMTAGTALVGLGSGIITTKKVYAQVSTIVFAEQRSSHAAPLIVAEAKGFFKAEGLNVEIKWFPSGGGPVINEGLGNKSIDVAHMGMVPALIAAAKMPVTIVSGTLIGGHALVVKPQITSLHQLRGKVLAIPKRGSLQDFYLRMMLMNKGIDPKTEVTIQEVPPDATAVALKQGTIDAAMLSDLIALKVTQDGSTKILAWAQGIFPNYLSEVLVIRKELIQQDSLTAKKLVNIYTKSIEFVKGNPKEAASLVAKALGVSESIALQSVQSVRWSAELNKNDCKKFAEEMVRMGFLEKMPDMERSITNL
jgi:NitT/TauT family transport system substrate-binding protein